MGENETAEIMYMFRYMYHNVWAPDHIFNGKSREWVKAFNLLIKKGFIERKKKYPGYNYRWIGVWPEGY